MFKNYFKTAWRSLIKNKGISFLNIAGLVLGMTAASLIFLWVQNELSFDSHPADSNLYRLTTETTDRSWIWEGSPMLLAAAIEKKVPEVKQVARLYADNAPVFELNGSPEIEKQCAYVDSNWFSLFQYHFTDGGAVGFGEHINTLVLSATAARKYFGNQRAVGGIVRIDSANYQVVGIVDDAPANSSFQYSAFIPIPALLMNKERLENGMNWDNTDYLTFVQLTAGSRKEQVAKKLTSVLQQESHDEKKGITADLVPLRGMHFENNLQASEFEHGNISVVYIFGLLGIVLLLVACINYVNLTTAKASLRSKEVSIRKIVGAGRKQLFIQFITEAGLVSMIALFLCVFAIYLLLPGFSEFTGKQFSWNLNPMVLWKVMGCTLFFSFILNSIYPALLLSSFKPLNMFRGISVLRLRDTNFRRVLVIIQFSVSIILISGTVVIYRQMRFIQHHNLGYDRAHILTVGIPFNQQFPDKALFMRTMQQQLMTQSQVEEVSMVNQPVVRISSATTGADWEGRDANFNPKVAQLSADASLLKTMHFDMAAGRWFEAGSAVDEHNFVLNETAVQTLNIRKPVTGQRFALHGREGQIVGVVKDFHFKSLHDKIGPLVVFNNPDWWNYFIVRTKSGDPADAMRMVKAVSKKFAAGIPMEFRFLDERFNDLYRQEQLSSALILAFAVIAVVISGMGLFGLAAFAAEQRTKEVGIRKILGASVASIGVLLSRSFIKLIAVAFLTASPIAWWLMSGWLEHFAYRIDMRWWMIGISGSFALLIALIITNYHAVKAALANPVESLRSQ